MGIDVLEKMSVSLTNNQVKYLFRELTNQEDHLFNKTDNSEGFLFFKKIFFIVVLGWGYIVTFQKFL
jgi:hypothetical protein